jgi:hypothetical protein
MTRIAVPLSIFAIAALTACSSYQPPATSSASATPTIKPSELPYRAGFGVVQNVKPAPAPMAGVGGSSPDSKSSSSGTPMYRLTIKMDDGKIQWVDTDSQEIKTGMRIELTPDRMIKPA